MKNKKLKEISKKVRAQLQWATLDKPEPVEFIRVFSNPRTRAHTLIVPDDPKVDRDHLAHLSALGHAVFCEQVHPLFAANSYFAGSTDKPRFVALAPALNAGTEWFIGHWLMETCPEPAKEHLREVLDSAEKALGAPQPPPVDVFLDAARIVAQAIKYLGEPIDCGGVLKKAVDTYLAIPPDKPSKNACIELINRLMATYTTMHARLVVEDGVEVWEVYEPEAAVASIQAGGESPAPAG
jgi:hypothetical protein